MSSMPRYRPCVEALCIIMTFSMKIASVIIIFHENMIFTKSTIFYCFAIEGVDTSCMTIVFSQGRHVMD